MSQSPLPRFNDTAQAFQHLTDAELRRAVALFSLIGKPWLVNAGSALANVALALRVPLGWVVRPTVYAHFCGGESIDDSEATIAKLAAHNVRTILDYSAEGLTAESDLDATCSEVLATIQAADGDARHAFAVFKVSGLSSNALLEKVGEEATEVILAAKDAAEGSDPEEVVKEVADLWFHTMVMLAHLDLNHTDVLRVLDARMGLSGLAEKAARKGHNAVSDDA